MNEQTTRQDCRSLANLANSQAQYINQLRRENEALLAENGRLRVEMGLNRKRPCLAEKQQNGGQ